MSDANYGKNHPRKNFTQNYFAIPKYQRDYAWKQSNIDDLFEDLQEAIDTDTGHYIGTFILSRKPDATTLTPEQIKNQLLEFVKNFMHDTEFRMRLGQDVYGNRALKHIFIERDEAILNQQGKPRYDLAALIRIQELKPEVEHIFAREPTFDFPNRGFETTEDYLTKMHQLGNLTLLESAINGACKNKTPEEKVSGENL